MEKKKLIIISHMFPNSLEPYGGIFIYKQVKSLAQLDKYKIYVISPIPYAPRILWFKKKWREYGKICPAYHEDNVEVLYPRYLSFPGRSLFFTRGITMFLSVFMIIRKLVEKDEKAIIHSHTLLPDGLAGALVKKFRRNIKTVCTARGSDVNIYPYRNKAAMALTRYSLARNDVLTAVCRSLGNKCIGLGGQSFNKKIHVVYNGVDEHWCNIGEQEKQMLKNHKTEYPFEPKILFVGEMSRQKGVYELVQAFIDIHRKYEKAALFMVGDGIEKEKLIQLCHENKISHRVFFTGGVSHEQVKIYMHSCDMLILPSYSEGMPNVVLEAMACGKPVVVSEVGGVGEIVEHKHNGIIIEPRSHQAIIDAVELLLKDRAVFNDITYNANIRINESFSWKKNAQQMDFIYQEVLI